MTDYILAENLDVSEIRALDDLDDSKMGEEVLDAIEPHKMTVNDISQEFAKKLGLNDTMYVKRDEETHDVVRSIIEDDDMMDTVKRLRYDSLESVREILPKNRILRESHESRNRKSSSSSSSSRSISRSRKKRTRSRIKNFVKHENFDYRKQQIGFKHRGNLYMSEQIIIFNIPKKFDRDVEFIKHIISLFPEIRIINFSHDNMKPEFLIARLVDEPDKIKKYFDQYVCTLSKFRHYEFRITKHEHSKSTPMLRFSYKVIQLPDDIITLD